MSKIGAAERLLQELGVTSPADIDIEAIAYYLGARVRFDALDGCEARILGSGDKAVITVNSRSSSARQRFSIAHELGHWQFHRGKKLMCRVHEMERDHKVAAASPERIADNFAAELLMPRYLFNPIARKYRGLNFTNVRDVAEIFKCSLTAAAIRLVESDELPGFLICHGRFGRKWFTRSPSIPSVWFPKSEVDEHSHAFNVLYGGRPSNQTPYRISADAWFDTRHAAKFNMLEQTMLLGGGESLTLLALTDLKMLETPEERKDY
jgi:hypothetical protein